MKSFGVGMICGVSLGLAVGAATLIFVVTPKTKAALTEVRSAQEQLDNQKCGRVMEEVREVGRDGCERMMATQHSVDSAAGTSTAAGYTALVEPTPVGGGSPLQLLDVVRPGLGTMLAKLQAAQQPQIAVRWVVAGHVKPMSSSAGYSYCWLGANGEVDTANCPTLGGVR